MKIKEVLNLDNDIYHNSEQYSEYWSSSNIKIYQETPREAFFQKNNKEKKQQSEALIFGTQLHDFFASKHINGQPFVWNEFEPPINKTTGLAYGIGTKAYNNAVENIENPINSNSLTQINDIWKMIKSSEYSWFFEKEILGRGIAEPSFFAENLIHKYKYRPDVLTDKYILDYKSITKKNGFKSNWTDKTLKYEIVNRGYDISASMYQFLEHERTGVWKKFIIIWIMKDPPYDILISDISPFCFEIFGDNDVIINNSAKKFLDIKDQHEACQITNFWPGLQNQFDVVNGIRMAEFSPMFETSFEQFEVK